MVVQAPVSEGTLGIKTGKLVSLANEKDIAALLCQGWELNEDLENIANNNSPMGMLPFRSFYLATDSTFIRMPRNEMQYGKWAYNDAAKTIALNYKNGAKEVLKIAAISSTELVLVNPAEDGKKQLKFKGKGSRYENKTEDPYYYSNQLWRIASKKAETDAEISKRVKDYIHFFILFYSDHIGRDEKTISFYGFPSCIKWYAGGIFMVKESDLDENWYACFYNKEQALKGYKLMEGIVTKKYNWSKDKIAWEKKNLLVLQQMYEKM